MSPTDEMEIGHYYHIKYEIAENDGRIFARTTSGYRYEQLARSEGNGKILVLANLCHNLFALLLRLNEVVPFVKDCLIYQEEVLLKDFPLFVSWRTGTEFSKLLKGE